MHGYQLWFDVGIKRYTTVTVSLDVLLLLWFDVGIKRYTTQDNTTQTFFQLWFDVGIKRYKTGECKINCVRL